MSEVRIAAEPRTEFGKGAARRVRRANKVPAVLYGHGEEPRHFSLPGHELMLALKHDPNVLLALQTADGEQLALPKSVVRDPIKGFLEHVDLVAVRKGEQVEVAVPLTVTGSPAPDVIVDQQVTQLSVLAEATHLPDHLEVSVDGLAAGGSVTAGQVELPKGTTLAGSPDDVVVQGLGAPSAAEVEASLVTDSPVAAGGEGETGADVDAGEGTGDVVPAEQGDGPDAQA